MVKSRLHSHHLKHNQPPPPQDKVVQNSNAMPDAAAFLKEELLMRKITPKAKCGARCAPKRKSVGQAITEEGILDISSTKGTAYKQKMMQENTLMNHWQGLLVFKSECECRNTWLNQS